jgi:hypothetical protein
VVAASHPKKAIIAEMKQQEGVEIGKPYKSTKHDTALHTTINWKSPTFWPVIEMAVC